MRLPTLPLAPWMDRARRWQARWPWALPAASFLAGWGGFLLVKRGENLAQTVALLGLLGWLWLLAEKPVMQLAERLTGRRLPRVLLLMVSQSLQQEILFFALPFFLGVVQKEAGQLAFMALLLAACLVSTLDHWYERYVADHPTRALLFHAYCCFVAGLVALPVILHLSLERTVPVALALVGAWVVLSLPWRLRELRDREARIAALALLACAPVLAWLFREHIPAAGLSVVDARISQTVEAREPGPEAREIGVTALRERGAAAYVRMHAPMGVAQSLIFDWRHEGRSLDRIPAEVRGSSGKGSWRTYTRKQNFTDNPLGRWQVDLLTPQGQLIKRLRFRVVEDAELQAEPKPEPETSRSSAPRGDATTPQALDEAAPPQDRPAPVEPAPLQMEEPRAAPPPA